MKSVEGRRVSPISCRNSIRRKRRRKLVKESGYSCKKKRRQKEGMYESSNGKAEGNSHSGG